MDVDKIQQIINAEAAGHAAIADQAVAGVRHAYAGLDWYDHPAITVAATRAGEVVRASSQASAALADAGMNRMLTEMVGGSPVRAGTMTITEPLRTGVSGWSGVYGRVADTVRFEVAKGRSLDEAIGVGLSRGDTMCKYDLSLARREQWRRSLMANPDAIGFRRVIHGSACGLCIAASDRTYTRGDLLPLHSHCVCSVSPITREHDPGGDLNDKDIADVYAAAGSTGAADLRKIRYDVVQHGELGPTLVNRADHFRGPADVARAKAGSATKAVADFDATRSVAQLQSTLADLERSAQTFTSAGTQARIAELQAKIAARS